MFSPMTKDAEAALTRAANEAVRQGDRRIGTDHLLLGLLYDSEVAGALGTDVDHARAAARELDRAALATIGINLESMPSPGPPRGVGHAPLTSGLRAVITRAVALAGAENTRKVQPGHLLAALRERRPPDSAAALLAALRIRHE